MRYSQRRSRSREDPSERVADAAAGDGRGPVGAALADEQQDRDRDERSPASPNTIDAPRQPTAAMSGTPMTRDDDRADVAAGDVGADREPAPLGRELLGEQAVADRVLRRAADPRHDVGMANVSEAGGERLGREPATEQQAAEPEQAAARDDPGQLRVAELDERPTRSAERGEEGDRVDARPRTRR